MESLLHSISSIFHHFNDSSLNFKGYSPLYIDYWKKIDTSIQRLFYISNIVDEDIDLNKHNLSTSLFKISSGKKSLIDIANSLNEPKTLDYRTFDYSSFKDCKIEDVIKIEFNKFYPNLIVQVKEAGLLKSLNKNSHIIFILNNQDKIVEILSTENADSKRVFNFYVNFIWGTLDENDRKLIARVGEEIVDTFSKVPGFFFEYIDFLLYKNYNALKNNLMYYLNELKIPYSLIPVDFVILHNKKKYVIKHKNSDICEVKGFKQLDYNHEKLLGFVK